MSQASQPLSIEEIAANVEAHPGTSVGIPKESLLNAWNCCCETIAESLMNHKSLIVPHFAHFVVQKQQEASGTWGVKTSFIPSVVFLSDFRDAYGIKRVPSMRQVHVGASVPTTINGSVVATKAGMARHAANNSIRDVIREVGKQVSKKQPVRLNMGFCEILFAADGSYNVKWEEEFARTFASHYVPCAPEAHQKKQQRPNTAKSIPSAARLGRFSVPDTYPTAESAAKGTKTSLSTQQQEKCRPGTARIPAPPSEAAAVHTSDYQAPTLANLPPGTPSIGRPSSCQSSARSVRSMGSQRSGRGGEGRTSASVLSSATPGMSPRRNQDIKNAIDQLKTTDTLTPYQKRKTRKTLFRQLRNKAYEESWQNQADMKRTVVAEEKARDKEKVEAFRQFITEEQTRSSREKMARKEEEKRIQEMNKQLALVREKLALPRSVEPGDIFDARQPTFFASTDKQVLTAQIEEANARRRREKEDDRKYGEKARQAAEEWNAKTHAENVEKKRQQDLLRQEYEKQVNTRRADDDHYRKTLTNGGALLFSGEDSQSQEKEDMRRVLERSRQVQQENKRVAEDRSRRQKEEFEDRRRQLIENQAASRRNDALLAAQQKREKDAVQHSLRSNWTSQIDRQAADRNAYKEHMKVWREHNYLKNESSDDDE